MPDVLTFSTKARDPPTNAAKHPARGRKITIAPNTDGGVDAFQSNSGRCSCCTPSSSRGRAKVAQLSARRRRETPPDELDELEEAD